MDEQRIAAIRRHFPGTDHAVGELLDEVGRLREVGERLCRELEYVWQAESHAARFRDAIDAWRALAGSGGGGEGA